jgi:hypothetical protein
MIFSRKDPIKEALDANLDGDFSVFSSGANAPKEEALREFEAYVGYSLPKDFRKFSMSPYGGIYIEVKETIWPQGKLYEIGPAWSFFRGMMTYGFAHNIPEWLDIRKQTEEFRASSGTLLVPFLKIVGNADVYCFDDRGSVRHWDHESGEAPRVAKTFTALFADEVAALRKRKDRKKSENKTT